MAELEPKWRMVSYQIEERELAHRHERRDGESGEEKRTQPRKATTEIGENQLKSSRRTESEDSLLVTFSDKLRR